MFRRSRARDGWHEPGTGSHDRARSRGADRSTRCSLLARPAGPPVPSPVSVSPPELPPLRLKVVSSGLTDVGKKRDHNEDSFLIDEDLKLFVVADGMGGHAGGGTASRIAVETIDRELRQARSTAARIASGTDESWRGVRASSTEP